MLVLNYTGDHFSYHLYADKCIMYLQKLKCYIAFYKYNTHINKISLKKLKYEIICFCHKISLKKY